MAVSLTEVLDGFRRAYTTLHDTNFCIVELPMVDGKVKLPPNVPHGEMHVLGCVVRKSGVFNFALCGRGYGRPTDGEVWKPLGQDAGAAIGLRQLGDITVAEGPSAIWAAVLFDRLEPYGFVHARPGYRLLTTPCLASIRVCELILATPGEAISAGASDGNTGLALPAANREQGEANGVAGLMLKKSRSPKPADSTPKRGRPVDKATIRRADFAKPLREQGKTWEEIAASYSNKYPRDIDASADTLRLAFQRQYPEPK